MIGQMETAQAPQRTPTLAMRPDMPNLDVLRAIAVLLVLGGHIAAQFGIHVTALAQYGVLIFFVHTSLVLMMSMERSGLRGKRLLANFYVRRFFRIYPLSILCVLAVVLLKVPVTSYVPYEPSSAGTIWSNLGLVMNLTGSPVVLSPLWSLPYEVDMYLALPFLFMIALAWKRGTGWLFAASVAAACSYWLLRYPPVDFLLYLPCFIGGVIAFLGFQKIPPRFAGWSWLACILAGSILFVGLHLIAKRLGYDDYIPRWIVTGGLGFLLPLFRELPPMRWAHLTAKYSYGIYLFHMIVIWFAFSYLKDLPLVAQSAIFVVLMAAIPLATFAILENPFIRFGKWLVSGIERKSRAAAA